MNERKGRWWKLAAGSGVDCGRKVELFVITFLSTPSVLATWALGWPIVPVTSSCLLLSLSLSFSNVISPLSSLLLPLRRISLTPFWSVSTRRFVMGYGRVESRHSRPKVHRRRRPIDISASSAYKATYQPCGQSATRASANIQDVPGGTVNIWGAEYKVKMKRKA